MVGTKTCTAQTEELFVGLPDVATDAAEDAVEVGDPEPSVVKESLLEPKSGMSLSRGNWYGILPHGAGFCDADSGINSGADVGGGDLGAGAGGSAGGSAGGGAGGGAGTVASP